MRKCRSEKVQKCRGVEVKRSFLRWDNRPLRADWILEPAPVYLRQIEEMDVSVGEGVHSPVAGEIHS